MLLKLFVKIDSIVVCDVFFSGQFYFDVMLFGLVVALLISETVQSLHDIFLFSTQDVDRIWRLMMSRTILVEGPRSLLPRTFDNVRGLGNIERLARQLRHL